MQFRKKMQKAYVQVESGSGSGLEKTDPVKNGTRSATLGLVPDFENQLYIVVLFS